MKRFFWFVMILVFFWACSTQKGVVKVAKSGDEIATDKIEYDMETFDAKFETWYALHNNPATYRAQDYYESWNRQYVAEWNIQATGRRSSFFEPIVGYDNSENYGFELNHQLFYYFQYVEHVLKVRILVNGPRAVVL